MDFFGGIWVLWNPNVIFIEPITSSFQEIHLECKLGNSSFLLTVIYASPFFERRKALWSSLSNMSPMLNILWLIIGDFNDISKAYEKFRGDYCAKQKFPLSIISSTVVTLLTWVLWVHLLLGPMGELGAKLLEAVLIELMQIFSGSHFSLITLFSIFLDLDLTTVSFFLKLITPCLEVSNPSGLKPCGWTTLTLTI